MVYESINSDPHFKPVQKIYEDRLRQFIDSSGDYKDNNLPKFYDKDRIQLDGLAVDVKYYQVPYDREISPVAPEKRPLWEHVIAMDEAGEINWSPVAIGQWFGPSWSTTWFKVHLRVPEEWLDSKEQLVFQWDCNNEGMVIDPENARPYTAFSGGGERTEYLIPKGKAVLPFYIECANNGMFGVGNGSSINPPNNDRFFRLDKADLVWPNWEARNLFVDFWMLGDAARELPDNSAQKHRARQLANRVMDLFDRDDASSVNVCRRFLREEFFDEYMDSSKVYQRGDSQIDATVWAMGNCHIDTAWLWPFAETKRKIVRSWSSQCVLMDEFPEYQFVASQGQQFKWLMDLHPGFFKDVLLPKVQQAQFFPIGGSWVENDTNIPSGESLCRQFLLGQRFFMKYFGMKSDIFWLPDTFGYSSQVPQICRISGIHRFLTQKLSWNNINNFPHTTFNWAGIDGTQVLTHMPPRNTYTAMAHFGDILGTAGQNKSNEVYGSGLLLYGYGDGGGGPTREMLLKMRRIRSMSNRNGNIVPKVHVGKSVSEFYQDILDKTHDGHDLATWNGELYFEFHRGTYTTQAETKMLMRFSEIKLHDLEWIATKTSVMLPDKYVYPAVEINNLWEDVLLCQFHDVIPGSCIEIVYKYESVPMLKAAISKAESLIADALKVLKGDEEELVPVNTLQWDVELPEDKPGVNEPSDIYTTSVTENSDSIILSNKKLQVKVDKRSGSIKSIEDLQGDTEYLDLVGGRNNLGANQFVLFDDQPLSWQAWDTELYSVNKYEYLNDVRSVRISEDTQNVVAVEVIIAISSNCQIISTISLSSIAKHRADEAIVHIKTVVENWNETNRFLKVEFPVNVRNDFASYETQFGITKRPTHYNTSWDVAKFEVCHHKFADYSEYTKGVSILNNCKYGFATHGNLMRLSLLRSSKAPDAHADMGTHEIEYAIYPHSGGLTAKTVELGIKFNYKYQYDIPKLLAKEFNDIISLIGDKNVILSNIKRGEDDEDVNSNYALDTKFETSIVVRVYESCGGESSATLLTSLDLKSVLKINSLELETVERLPFKPAKDNCNSRSEIPIKLRPFEIATYKLIL
ncbi:alpha-mannosidase Ecym_3349 [Eremothecium cymbalariae DBVPG|uniref:Alpha-mannosidase n=1 Tax=Eremothecium cymbalariae (strain CBS 270.75 / DBVPG 7215 / KCTC 17166 / NRRL Y-17582) TaxID=931890 RepID=G8JRR8_ERECY|nr:Hypothetical protein Ecym_3349 [Eremothecium cymbalariae DBVPG\